MRPQKLMEILQNILPGSEVMVEDMTGTMDHFRVQVVSELFEGKSRVDRHKMVFDPLQPYFASNEIHALTLKAYTPAQLQELQS